MRITSGLAPKLNQIYFYLNEGHNLACRACWAQQKANLRFSPNGRQPTGGLLIHAAQSAHLDPRLFEQAVQEAQPLGLKSVKLTGGEPLLHPEFDALVEILAKTELKFSIETNGVGLTQERAQHLANLQRVNVAVGLEGADAESHDRLRGMPGSFEIATQAARMFAKAGLKPQIVFSLVKENAGQITALIQLAESLGAWAVRFFLVHPHANGQPPAPDEPSLLAVEELIALGRRVERDLSPNTRLHLFYEQPPAFRGLNPQGPTEVHRRCGVLNAISVLTSGGYALCGVGSMTPELIFGQVGADPLDKIWREHPILLHLRDGMPNRLAGVCERCVMKNSCLGNCVVQNYINSGSFWGPFWFCEAAERARLFPVHRLRDNSVW
jgi:SynChlorMet cassette radical SAM/SPASM protein ScmF